MSIEKSNKVRMKLTGRVLNVIKKGGYGFIVTDDGKRFFFHANATRLKQLPAKDDFVQFTPVWQLISTKHHRAIHVEVVASAVQAEVNA